MNILKSLLANGYWSRNEGRIRWSMSISSLLPPLLFDRFHLLARFQITFFHYMQIINVIFAITLWTFLTSDLWVTFAYKVFGKYFKKTFTTTVFYHLSVQHIAKKYYIVFTFCLRMDGAVFIEIFHFFVKYFALILASWYVYCPTVENYLNFRNYWFHTWNSHKNVPLTHVISKWMHFQIALSS